MVILRKCIAVVLIIIIFAIIFIAFSDENALSLITEVNKILTIIIVAVSFVIVAANKIFNKYPIIGPKVDIFLKLNNLLWTALIVLGKFIFKLDFSFIYRNLIPSITMLVFAIFMIVTYLEELAFSFFSKDKIRPI